MKTGFTVVHPLTQAVLFFSCIFVTMFIMHPVFLGISFVLSTVYILYSQGFKKLLSALKLNIITSLMIIIINPLISHAGVTVLAYLPDGNAITLESIVFGAAAATLMSCTINWFCCINYALTSDRVIYLFSRIAPKLGLLISMTLRFAGKISEHYRSVKAAQISFRQDKRSLMQKIKSSARLMSSVIQWSLESSVDTADSMKSRGYATGRRTSYHNFRIKRKDVLLIAAIVSSDMMIIYFSVSEIIYFIYYPMIEINIESYKSFAAFAAFAMICIIPLITDIREEKLWKHYGSAV